MKYCHKCGAELFDEAVICPKCGCAQDIIANPKPYKITGIAITAYVFLILHCCAYWVVSLTILLPSVGPNAGALAILIIALPLAWIMPMTIYYGIKISKNKQVGIGFKICSLLFVSLIAGILMLCDNE